MIRSKMSNIRLVKPLQKMVLGRTYNLNKPYYVKKLLGEGGIGAVYEVYALSDIPSSRSSSGQNAPLSLRKAMKVISPESPMLKEQGGRSLLHKLITAEAEINLAIENLDDIVTIQDVGRWPDGSIYIIYPFVDGPSLLQLNEHHIEKNELIPIDISAFFLFRAAKVLRETQRKNVSHGDLSLNNIMLNSSGSPRFIDWGSAHGMNRGGCLIGNPAYIAPEILAQERDISLSPDDYCRADMFSLGVCALELLTGENPFVPTEQDGASFDYRNKLNLETALYPLKKCTDIPSQMSYVASALIAENPASRPTADQLMGMIGDFLYKGSGFGITTEVSGAWLKYFYYQSFPSETPLPKSYSGDYLKKIRGKNEREPEKFGDIKRKIEDAYEK